MNDRDLLIIKSLYEYKNITKTAQALFISQPALSARIHQIEDHFNVKMIYRGNKGIHFTPAGEYLVQCAEKILTDMRRMEENVVNLGDGVKGVLRLCASLYMARYVLPRLLSLFQQQYPNIEFKVTTVRSRDIFNLMHKENFHVGFVRADYDWQDEKHVLFEERICIASRKPIQLEDLPKLPRIDYHTDYLNKIALEHWWKENFSQTPTISMAVDHIDVCKEMVMHGLGYAILPSMILSNIKDIYTMDIYDKTGKPMLRESSILYQKELLDIKIVSTFLSFVKEIDFNSAFFSTSS